MPVLTYKYDDLMNPVIHALKQLGGSGTNEEINNKVAEIAGIPSAELEVLHNPNKGGMTEIEYRLMWTRTYLKKYGIIDNSARGVWALTAKGNQVNSVDERDVVRLGREQLKMDKETEAVSEEQPDRHVAWQEELLGTILEIPPSTFERLVQRLLRESGFIQVEVTGRTGDGGVDGHGVLRLGGFLGFRIVFQAKRWKGTVGASQVRDFRGAIIPTYYLLECFQMMLSVIRQ